MLPVLTAMIKQGLTTDQYQDVQTPQAICVVPTRELALQIYNDCRKFSYQTDIRAVVLYGGTSVGYQMKQIEHGANFVIGTPGRLLDVINRGKVILVLQFGNTVLVAERKKKVEFQSAFNRQFLQLALSYGSSCLSKGLFSIMDC